MEEAIVAFQSRLKGTPVQYHIQVPPVLPRLLKLEIEAAVWGENEHLECNIRCVLWSEFWKV